MYRGYKPKRLINTGQDLTKKTFDDEIEKELPLPDERTEVKKNISQWILKPKYAQVKYKYFKIVSNTVFDLMYFSITAFQRTTRLSNSSLEKISDFPPIDWDLLVVGCSSIDQITAYQSFITQRPP